jgi:D-3-phosphoglycerate dehydrogenase
VRIVVADDLPASAIDLLRAEGWTIDAQSGRSPEQLKIDLAEADALVVRSATKVTADIIAAAPRLRAIARAGTGVDNVHVETASARGIVVMNAPGANSISVAELAMAQILSLARKLPAADASMKQGVWDKKSFLGEEVRGKVLGLAGLGRIGQEVARRAQAFEMTVIAHDPFIAQQAAANIGIELVSLDDLCARADYLSLHMPSTPQTKRTFNAERLAKCKKGLRLVNTARRHSWPRSSLGTSAARRWMCTKVSQRRITRSRSWPRWWRARTSRPRREKDRNWWALRPPRRSAISSRPGSFETP